MQILYIIIITATTLTFLFLLLQQRRKSARMQRQLRRSEGNWRSIVEHAADIVITMEATGKILFINRTVPGITVAQVEGSAIYEYIGDEFHEQVKKNIAKVFDNSEIASCEIPALGPHNSTCWYQCRISPLKRDRTVIAAIVVARDISEAKRQQQDNYQKQLLLEKLVTQTMAMMRIDGADRRGTYFNDSWLHFTGLNLQNAENWRQKIHPHDVDRYDKAYNEVSAEQYVETEYRLQNSSQEYRWILERGSIVRDEQGNYCEYIAIAIDIDERKRIEQKLQENYQIAKTTIQKNVDNLEQQQTSLNSERQQRLTAERQLQEMQQQVSELQQQLQDNEEELERACTSLADEINRRSQEQQEHVRTIVENLPVMVCAVDEEFRFIVWNRECERKTGYSAQEIVNNPQALKILYPDPEYRRQLNHSMFRQLGKFSELKWTLTDKQGQSKTIAWTAMTSLYEIPGWGQWMLGMDVSEYRQQIANTEQLINDLLNSTTDGIFAFDSEYRYTIWNSMMEYIYGTNKAEVLGQRIFDVAPFLSESGDKKYFEDTLAGKNAISCNRSFIIQKTGSKGYFDAHYHPLYDVNGKVVGGIVFIRDVTKRKILETEIEKLSRMGILELFCEGLVHQLSEPLAFVATRLRKLKDNQDPELVVEVESKIHHIKGTLRKISTFFRSSGEKANICKINLLLEETAELLKLDPRSKQIEFHLDLEQELSPTIGCKEKLQQAFLNIGLNALDAMPDGGTLTFKVERHEEEFVISINDTGIGIETKDHGKVFDPFYTSKKSSRQMGLGLHASLKYIQEHNGTMQIQSKQGNGTTVLVRIPLQHPESNN